MNDQEHRTMDNTREYASYFGLREEAFAPTCDPAWFHAAPQHVNCLKRLWGCIDWREGVGIALGAFGVGKTMLMRKIASDLASAPERYSIAVVGAPLSSWTSHDLLGHIVRQFGLKPLDTSIAGLCEAMNAHLLSNIECNCVLLIDDAHLLVRRGHLELLRILQTLETPRHKLLNIICFANTEWEQALHAVPGFMQHAGLVVSLEPARLETIEQLVAWRLRHAAIDADAAGAPRFTSAALRAIHAYAAGNLRLVMNACRNALYQAWQQQTRVIDHKVVLDAFEASLSMDADSRARVAAVLLDAARETSTPIDAPMETLADETMAPGEASPRRAAPAYSSERDKKAAELLLKHPSEPTP